ncbi:DUF1365 domain-containing protein [Conexibacter woesei]|uniref:DUF1365 domain-containing protein n=1 Tax=Conexibacter woesei TaxID=191495 RepID=UPI000405A15F|nr:DUF1365 domain-containing protein [Conexibacter woesei]
MTAAASPVLYAGTVRHRRRAVRRHTIRHRVAMALVDLERLPAPAARGLIRFDPEDYMSVADVRTRTGIATGPIRLLTLPRSLGKAFNPVSFYYAYNNDETLGAVVAEVTSTPWGERHAYVLEASDGARVHRGDDDKALHVSPFLGMDHHYSWAATEPRATLSVHIALDDAFDATLNLERRPWRTRALLGASLRTLFLIYAHAAVLALKRVPVHPRPTEPTPS